MPDRFPDSMSDVFRVASQRGELPTALDTEGIRQLDAGVRARSVFSARTTNAIYVSKIKEVVDLIAAGSIDDATARVTLLETLRAMGYTPEGGFPSDVPGTVPPAVRGSIQDLSSFKRINLIVETQRELMRGAGVQARGHTPDRLEAFPAWEVYTAIPSTVPRDWEARALLAGLKFYGEPNGSIPGAPGRLIGLKGDPGWGELGSSDNFSDALDVDYAPFYFNSGKRLREVPRAECLALGVTGPDGESIDEYHRGPKRPRVLAGELPLPTPRISLKDVDPEIVKAVMEATKATSNPNKPGMIDFSDLLEDALMERRSK